MGFVGAWSLHPSQVAIAKAVFSPAVEEVRFAVGDPAEQIRAILGQARGARSYTR